jgi:hypothetical protein
MKCWPFLLVFCSITSKVYLQIASVLEGRVGNDPIVVWLNEDVDKTSKTANTSATYFYKGNRHNIKGEGHRLCNPNFR